MCACVWKSQTFPYTLVVEPPLGTSALSQGAFDTVAAVLNELVLIPDVAEVTSIDDFASVRGDGDWA